MMSVRIPKDEPLPPEMKRLGRTGLFIVGFLALTWGIHLLSVWAS